MVRSLTTLGVNQNLTLKTWWMTILNYSYHLTPSPAVDAPPVFLFKMTSFVWEGLYFIFHFELRFKLRNFFHTEVFKIKNLTRKNILIDLFLSTTWYFSSLRSYSEKPDFFMAFGNIYQGGVNWLSIWRWSGQMSNESLLMIRGIFPWRRLTDLYRPWGRLELGADWPIQFTSSSKSFKISETLSKTLQINNIRTRD